MSKIAYPNENVLVEEKHPSKVEVLESITNDLYKAVMEAIEEKSQEEPTEDM